MTYKKLKDDEIKKQINITKKSLALKMIEKNKQSQANPLKLD